MKCKFCNEELPERGHFCPICGKSQLEEPAPEEQVELTFGEEELIAQALEAEPELQQASDEVQEQPIDAPSQVKKAKRVAAITGCIAALAVLALVLFMGIRGGWDVSSWFDWQIFRENTIAYKDSYTVEDKKAANKGDVVVATMGEQQLTNSQLQIYYWNEVYTFISNNYYYLSYYGLDYTQPLDEQDYPQSEQTWQQYFLECALQTWHANLSLYNEAKANNFVLPEEQRAELDSLAANLEKQAAEGGYENVDAMVQESFGAGCTLQDYLDYMEIYYYGYLYFAEVYENIDPTMEEIENYFTENEATLKNSGVTKESGNSVDVRHILMKIDNYLIEDEGTQEETTEPQAEETTEGETEDNQEEESKYSDAEWAACYAAAEEILNLWLTNPTEDYFAELANEHSDDQDGKVTNGGIYQGITSSTKFVEPFLNWCMDENRQVGDYEIVQTDYGYHIMYFSASEPIWVGECRDALISATAQELVNGAYEKYAVEIDYKKIVLAEVTF